MTAHSGEFRQNAASDPSGQMGARGASTVYRRGMESRQRWVVAVAAIAAGLLSGVLAFGLAVGRRRTSVLAPDGVVDSGEERRQGSPDDRGRVQTYGIDIERLRGAADEFEPAVEYLTYIQSRRGDDSHLLFVRHEDLDAIAALEGADPESFLRRLQRLGVVISNN